jgi:hypothetical protein
MSIKQKKFNPMRKNQMKTEKMNPKKSKNFLQSEERKVLKLQNQNQREK